MNYEIKEQLYDFINEICINGYLYGASPVELVEQVWANPSFPMHCSEHHYLVPAVLLSIYRRLKNDSIDVLKKDLGNASERAKNLLGGFCGWYGACGAAVGSGVFLSILTDTNPYSEKKWGQVNMLTAECLANISQVGGPRCCKRVCYTCISTTTKFMTEQFDLHIDTLPKIVCKYSERNNECKKNVCPYYGG